MNNLISKMYERKMFVHNGTFHADDVFCVALVNLFRYMNDIDTNIDVVRVSKIEEITDQDKEKYLICDLLGGDFDHHMESAKKAYRDNGHKFPYASFGLLWRAIGQQFAPELDIVERFDKNFILPIDYVDNFGPFREIKSPISRVMSNFNAESDQASGFNKAVEMAEIILGGEIRAEIAELSALKLINSAKVKNTEGKNKYSYLLIPSDTAENKFSSIGMVSINEFCAEEEHKTIKFVINLNPSPRDGSIRLLTVNGGKLTKATIDGGKIMDGCVFIHNDGFLATFKDIKSMNKFIGSDIFKVE